MLAEIISLFLFGILGYQDLKTRRVDNVLIMVLWIPTMLLEPNMLLSAFVSLGLLNEVVARFFGPIVGWGDVLMFGPFMAVLSALGLYYAIAGYYAVALCFIASYIWKKKIPLGAVFFVIYLLSTAIHCVV